MGSEPANERIRIAFERIAQEVAVRDWLFGFGVGLKTLPADSDTMAWSE